MNGIGPLEPGEGTRAWGTSDRDDPDDLDAPEPPPRTGILAHGPLAPLARLYRRHRRTALTTLTLALLLAGGGYLTAVRQDAPPPPPPPPAPPYPSLVTDVSYLDEVAAPHAAGTRTFSFAVLVSVRSGPPVTVTGIDQPYAGLSLTSEPRTPFLIRAGSAHKVAITMHVKECGKVPGNAGLPFLDVTLRNKRAIQVHSFILGSRYAQSLSQALQVACGNDSR
ncbi:Tat pathway signal sequence domain protein [Streptomyces sp. NPDC006700]|uniref:Tat pathway signal sequence domain protein n=1 Tax=unclassified Streptomyces TaxID=2593676 RepID=UPI0033FB03EB